MLTVTFDELEDALAASQAPVAASEAHGSLCGALAAVPAFDVHAWVADLVPPDAGAPAALRSRNLLETLADETRSALEGQEFEFEPLLPDDEAPIERRVAALAEWSAGFLYGLGTGGLAADSTTAPAAVAEIMRDFGEISRATVDSDESAESSEASYAEIVEYLRAGAQLAYEELAGHRAGRAT
jgi:hypothetical protein